MQLGLCYSSLAGIYKLRRDVKKWLNDKQILSTWHISGTILGARGRSTKKICPHGTCIQWSSESKNRVSRQDSAVRKPQQDGGQITQLRTSFPTECSVASDLSVKSDSIYNRGSTGRTVRREVMLFLGGNFLGVVSTMDDAPGIKQGMWKLVVTLPLPLGKHGLPQ